MGIRQPFVGAQLNSFTLTHANPDGRLRYCDHFRYCSRAFGGWSVLFVAAVSGTGGWFVYRLVFGKANLLKGARFVYFMVVTNNGLKDGEEKYISRILIFLLTPRSI